MFALLLFFITLSQCKSLLINTSHPLFNVQDNLTDRMPLSLHQVNITMDILHTNVSTFMDHAFESAIPLLPNSSLPLISDALKNLKSLILSRFNTTARLILIQHTHNLNELDQDLQNEWTRIIKTTAIKWGKANFSPLLYQNKKSIKNDVDSISIVTARKEAKEKLGIQIV